MKVEDIKSVDDVSNYIEGCLNDFNEGISTLDETNKYLHELTVRVIEIAQASLQPISEETVRFIIKEWSSESEKKEPDHEELVQSWIDTDFAKWLLSRGVAKESVPSELLSEQEIKELGGIRAYFGTHDKSSFEHNAFAVLNRIIPKLRLSMSTTSKEITIEDVREEWVRLDKAQGTPCYSPDPCGCANCVLPK